MVFSPTFSSFLSITFSDEPCSFSLKNLTRWLTLARGEGLTFFAFLVFFLLSHKGTLSLRRNPFHLFLRTEDYHSCRRPSDFFFKLAPRLLCVFRFAIRTPFLIEGKDARTDTVLLQTFYVFSTLLSFREAFFCARNWSLVVIFFRRPSIQDQPFFLLSDWSFINRSCCSFFQALP